MSVLLELILEFFVAGIGPGTDRGIVVTWTLISLALLLLTLGLWTAWPGVYLGSALVGVGGCLISILHLRRVPADRALALFCVAVNVAAVVVPMRIWLTRV